MINLTKSMHVNDKCLIQMLYEMSKCHIAVHINVKCFSCMLKATVSMLLTGSTKIRAPGGEVTGCPVTSFQVVGRMVCSLAKDVERNPVSSSSSSGSATDDITLRFRFAASHWQLRKRTSMKHFFFLICETFDLFANLKSVS